MLVQKLKSTFSKNSYKISEFNQPITHLLAVATFSYILKICIEINCLIKVSVKVDTRSIPGLCRGQSLSLVSSLIHAIHVAMLYDTTSGQDVKTSTSGGGGDGSPSPEFPQQISPNIRD